MYSRREFGRLTLSGLPLAAMSMRTTWTGQLASTVRGVKLGVITAGFRGGRGQGPAGAAATAPAPAGDPADEIIADLIQIGAANVELSANLYGAPGLVGGAVGGQAPGTLT